ncbi:MAG: choice-of-anchor Q domain-containing protein, partial [Rubrobacteraceae bacterium]
EEHGECLFQGSEGGSMLRMGHPRFLSSGSRMAPFLSHTESTQHTSSGSGGGIDALGTTTIEYTTITANTAREGGGSGVSATGRDQDRTEVASSIIAANTNSDVDYFFNPPDTPFVSQGYNVIGFGEGADDFNGRGDINEVSDPGLGPLGDNGGPTQTHALQSGSPALDRVAEGECTLDTDQRGVIRPQDGDGNGSALCDSGSFEKEAASTPPPEVTPPPAKANLSLTKKASKGRPTVGTKITYTLRVRNSGPDRATGVKVADTLPRGVKVTSSSRGCKKQSARKVVCNIGTLADGKSAAKKITVKVTRKGKLVNTARASSSVSDPNPRNNGAKAVVRAKPKRAVLSRPRPTPTKRVSCKVENPSVRLAQGKQVVVADTKPGKSVACVVQSNQLALAKALKNRNLGLVRQGNKQVRAAKGKVVKVGARKVAVRVPRGF